MKVGDLVRNKRDKRIGLIVNFGAHFVWTRYTGDPEHTWRVPKHHLEVINEGR